MARITELTQFVGDIYIPLAVGQISSTPNLATPNNEAVLTAKIDEVEKLILLNALGLSNYNELQTALSDLDNADQKWKDLVNGVEYDGKLWEGLKHSKSLLVYAIYYEFLCDNNRGRFTVNGIAKAKDENKEFVNPNFKLVDAYRKFIEKYQKGYCFEPRISYIDGVRFTDYSVNTEDVIVSLFQFLEDKKDDYSFDKSKFKTYQNINTFDLQ